MPTASEPRALTGTNVEIKARVASFDEVRERARAIGARRDRAERQTDVYYVVPRGRLKLRHSSADGAHLVVYRRPDGPDPRVSRFHRLPVADPDGLGRALDWMLGARATVTKVRELWWWKDVRIHLDEVDGLGPFVELEARLDAIGDEAEARRRVDELSEALGLSDRLRGSYGEMT